MTETIASQIAVGLEPLEGSAWQRTTVSYFRPVTSPDGQGGSTVTVSATSTGTVTGDPVSQESGQIFLAPEEADLRVGDYLMIPHSQFRE